MTCLCVAGFVSGLCNESKEHAVTHLLTHLPLLSPGNTDAKQEYLNIIPKVRSSTSYPRLPLNTVPKTSISASYQHHTQVLVITSTPYPSKVGRGPQQGVIRAVGEGSSTLNVWKVSHSGDGLYFTPCVEATSELCVQRVLLSDNWCDVLLQVLAHSIENAIHLEESRQLLSYSLIHPAISTEERSQFTLWLSHLEERDRRAHTHTHTHTHTHARAHAHTHAHTHTPIHTEDVHAQSADKYTRNLSFRD